MQLFKAHYAARGVEKNIGVILLYLLFDTEVLSVTLAVDAGGFKNNRIRGVRFGQSEIP